MALLEATAIAFPADAPSAYHRHDADARASGARDAQPGAATAGAWGAGDAVAEAGGQRRRRRRWDGVSVVLFAALAVLLVAIGVVYVRDRTDDDPTQVPPTRPPGNAEIITVVGALENEDLEVAFGRGRGVPRGTLDVPGQALVVDGVALYAFIYTEVATREREGASVDVEEVLAAASSAGTPGTAGPGEAHVAQGSNVLVVLAGGDEELAAAVERAIASIP